MLTSLLSQIVQLHAHWGGQAGAGSEHTLDGRSCDGELHLVHFNRKYDNPGQALDKQDGLAVLGILLTAGPEDHQEFEKIFKRFSEIEQAQDIVELSEDLDLNNLLPPSRSYWTYPGSLTTPPLYESVTWILFKQTLEISHRQASRSCSVKLTSLDWRALFQFDLLRSLKTGAGNKKPLINNYRPTCPAMDRTPRSNCCQ